MHISATSDLVSCNASTRHSSRTVFPGYPLTRKWRFPKSLKNAFAGRFSDTKDYADICYFLNSLVNNQIANK